MPTLYGKKTTVQLSVSDLRRATTPNPRTQQSPTTSASIRDIAQQFARDSIDGTLSETPLYTEEGSHVRFLGNNRDMLFYMVHAGKNFFDLTTTEQRNTRPARVPLARKKSAGTAVVLDGEKIGVGTSKDAGIEPNRKYKPPFIPHALCLTVFLSNKSFEGSKDKATAITEINDVKIDVYFNGAPCGSHYVPRRYSGEAHTMTEHIVRFTGHRIGRLIEKPWVIVPSGQNPDGGLREYRRGKVAYAGAQHRWNEISDALMSEADEIGQDENGERPIIGEYLESLAQLSMPKEIEEMQKAGSPKFGILDAVITWGKGNKDGPETAYIINPTPIRHEGFTTTNLDQSVDHSPVQSIATTRDRTYTAPQSRSEALGNAKSIDDYSKTSPLSVAPSPVPTPSNKTNPVPSSPPNVRLLPALPLEKAVKRSRGHYYDIITTKQTLSEQIDSIATAIINDHKAGCNPTIPTNARTTQTSFASTAGSSPLSSAPMTRDHTPAQRKIVKLKLPSPTSPATKSDKMTTRRVQDGKADTPAPWSRRRDRVPTQLNADALDRDFQTPALSVDCATTYASSGTVRNVGAARAGVFTEGGVVMGARFVVGG